jgi:hypothetical protein
MLGEISRDLGPLQEKLRASWRLQTPGRPGAQPAILLENLPGQQLKTRARNRTPYVEYLLAVRRKVKSNLGAFHSGAPQTVVDA